MKITISEETKQALAELKASTLKSYIDKARDSDVTGKGRQRIRGVVTAYHKLDRKEGVKNEEALAELSTKTLMRYKSKAIDDAQDANMQSDHKLMNKRVKGYNKALDKIHARGWSGKPKEYSDNMSDYKKEEVELDESYDAKDYVWKHHGNIKGTMGYLVHKPSGRIASNVVKVNDNRKHNTSPSKEDVRKLVKPNFDPEQHKPFTHPYDDEGNLKPKIKEGIELDEARGRPPKEGSDAWKRKHGIAIEPTKRQAKKIAAANKARHANGVVHNDPADDDSDEGQYGKPRADYGNDVTPVITHLKKAMDNEKDSHSVPFSNGKTHSVPKHVAKTVHDGIMGLKPEMRGKVQDHIQKSHENLMQVHKIFTGS